MTIAARLAALSRRVERTTEAGAFHVTGEQRDGGPITYTVLPRSTREDGMVLDAAAFEAFRATHPIARIRIYEYESATHTARRREERA